MRPIILLKRYIINKHQRSRLEALTNTYHHNLNPGLTFIIEGPREALQGIFLVMSLAIPFFFNAFLFEIQELLFPFLVILSRGHILVGEGTQLRLVVEITQRIVAKVHGHIIGLQVLYIAE